MKLRLVAKQHQQCVGPLDQQLDAGRAAWQAFDMHLNTTELARRKLYRQVLGRAGLGRPDGEACQGRANLLGGRRG